MLPYNIRMKKKLLKYFAAFQTKYTKQSYVVVALLLLTSFSLFISLRGDVPHSSELGYIESSSFSGVSGSVVPASCESGYEHYASECVCYGNTTCGVCGNAACPVAPVCTISNESGSCADYPGYSGGTFTYQYDSCTGPIMSSLNTGGCVPTPTPTPTPTCVSNAGQSCSASNSCGTATNFGTYDCNGNCSASAPADPSYFMDPCANVNSCNQWSGGNLDCNASCVPGPSNSTCPDIPIVVTATCPAAAAYDACDNANPNNFYTDECCTGSCLGLRCGTKTTEPVCTVETGSEPCSTYGKSGTSLVFNYNSCTMAWTGIVSNGCYDAPPTCVVTNETGNCADYPGYSGGTFTYQNNSCTGPIESSLNTSGCVSTSPTSPTTPTPPVVIEPIAPVVIEPTTPTTPTIPTIPNCVPDGSCTLSNICSVSSCVDNCGSHQGTKSCTGTWSFDGCPTNPGYPGGDVGWTCAGGNGVCASGAPADISCPGVCTNGAINHPVCNQCPANLAWDGASCVPCSNGGCTGGGGSEADPNGSLVCNNGSEDVPMCTPKPNQTIKVDGVTNLAVSNYGYRANLDWEAGTNHLSYPYSSCAVSGSWGGTFPPYTGNGLTDFLTVGGTFAYNYTCANIGGSTVATARITVCESDTPVLSVGGDCLGGPVAGLSFVTGNYTPSATVRISCTNSDSYVLKRGSVIEDSGSINATVFAQNKNISTQGDYELFCSYTSKDGHTFTDTSDLPLKYRTKPPEPIVSITASPISLTKGSASIVSWTVMFPNSVQQPVRNPACSLRAAPVCTGTCTPEQISASTTVNAILKTKKTDQNDPSGSRLITTAVNTLVFPGSDDWRARGKKTINLDKSMDFILNCGGPGTQSSSTVRVIVTSTNEG